MHLYCLFYSLSTSNLNLKTCWCHISRLWKTTFCTLLRNVTNIFTGHKHNMLLSLVCATLTRNIYFQSNLTKNCWICALPNTIMQFDITYNMLTYFIKFWEQLMEVGEMDNQDSQSPSWSKLLYDFTQSTTIHGVRYIPLHSKFRIRR